MKVTSQPILDRSRVRTEAASATLRTGRRRPLRHAGVYLALTILGAGSILPLLWMLSTSIKQTTAFYVYPPKFLPDHPTFANFTDFFHRGAWRYLTNSVIVAVAMTVIVVVTSTMAGYAVAKIPFRGRNLVFGILLSGLMIPWEITIIPLYIIVVKIGWVNTYQGVVLPMCATPLGIFIMRQFLRSIPSELIDAARVDGASEFAIFRQIVVPLCKPATAALATIIFLSAWGAFLWPLIASSQNEKQTLPVAIALFKQQYSSSYGLMMAAATVAFVPALAIFLAFQRYFVQGITMSGFKG
ncbi:MAG TPA: carbohydrate ABC transporter permease [Thermomicrobiales bacterium]|jgi:ABC-type glycerol-3-phosphate transport system permease component